MTSSAPSPRTQSTLVVLVVVATCAPRCLASWIAIVPTPPEPAWMSTFWPGRTFAFSTSACHAVSATSGSAAASAIVSPAGLRARSASSTAMSSAKVPMRSLSGRP